MSEYGGIEVYFTFTPAASLSITLITDIYAAKAYSPEDELAILALSAERTIVGADQYITSKLILIDEYGGETVIDQADFLIGTDNDTEYELRFFIYDTYISAYCNDRWIYSWAVSTVSYTDDADVIASLQANGATVELRDIQRTELCDVREAVYVDYEATSENAIQSVIQQRPVEIVPGTGRTLEFAYTATKDEVTGHHVRTFAPTVQDNTQLSSDGIVYYRDVGISLDANTAEVVGLITRLYRLSELDSGAVRAARKYQEKALEQRLLSTITQRLDPRFEVRDIYNLSLITSGTLRSIEEELIIENIDISLENGQYSMTISARENI